MDSAQEHWTVWTLLLPVLPVLANTMFLLVLCIYWATFKSILYPRTILQVDRKLVSLINQRLGLFGKQECKICFDDYDAEDGLCCSKNISHFFCDECFVNKVRHVSETQGYDTNPKGDIVCECEEEDRSKCHEPFTQKAITLHLPDDACANYYAYKQSITAARTEVEVLQRQQDLEARRQLLSRVEREAADIRESILNDILTLKCPHCDRAFLDFQGCFALVCICKGNFCAWCLSPADSSRAAHICALQCSRQLGHGAEYFVSETMSCLRCLTYHCTAPT